MVQVGIYIFQVGELPGHCLQCLISYSHLRLAFSINYRCALPVGEEVRLTTSGSSWYLYFSGR